MFWPRYEADAYDAAMSSVGPHDQLTNVQPGGLWIHRGTPPTMQLVHRHDDIEVNIVLRGRLDYIFGGGHLTVRAGELALFWGATPHRLVPQPGCDPAATSGCWIHIPLSTALGWNLPEDEMGEVLNMSAILAPSEDLPYDPDRMFEAWRRELHNGTEALGDVPGLLEVQAMVRRVLHHQARRSPNADIHGADIHDYEGRQGGVLRAVTVMARFIAENFRERVTVADIATAAHLNRTYAATIFSRTLGTTPGEYLNRCRIAEAQRLLVMTNRTMADIAHESGFSSQSSYYEHFTRRCGSSPGAYRRSFR